MKKRLMLALMLILCAALLASCSDGKKYDVLTSNGGNQQSQQNMGQQSANQWENDYDPLAEEDDYSAMDDSWIVDLPEPVVATATPAPTVRSEYAGATPVVVDPIDKPTPTPVPKLSLTHVAYDATKLGLSFEGPAGWTPDDSASDTFIIQNPNPHMDYRATLTLQAQKVSGDYTTSELKSVINSMLSAIGDAGFEEYNPSQTANRDLLGKTGVYANYDGTLLVDGQKVQIAGRVHAVCVDKKLYTIHLSTPKAQWNEYKEMVYDHLRDTITIIK